MTPYYLMLENWQILLFLVLRSFKLEIKNKKTELNKKLKPNLKKILQWLRNEIS